MCEFCFDVKKIMNKPNGGYQIEGERILCDCKCMPAAICKNCKHHRVEKGQFKPLEIEQVPWQGPFDAVVTTNMVERQLIVNSPSDKDFRNYILKAITWLVSYKHILLICDGESIAYVIKLKNTLEGEGAKRYLDKYMTAITQENPASRYFTVSHAMSKIIVDYIKVNGKLVDKNFKYKKTDKIEIRLHI